MAHNHPMSDHRPEAPRRRPAPPESRVSGRTSWGTGVLRSLGLVFGDIGTSPIYTLTVVVSLTVPTEKHILGVLSLIVWTLILLVTLEYAWLAMSLSRRGEGGTIVLSEILVPLIDRKSVV
jgi:KUP system potassium uptake protein